MYDKLKEILEELFFNGSRRNPKMFDYYLKEDVNTALGKIKELIIEENKKRIMSEDEFIKLLSELHSEIADMSDGCMGTSSCYTPEKIKERRKNSVHYDYLERILRQYIRVR